MMGLPVEPMSLVVPILVVLGMAASSAPEVPQRAFLHVEGGHIYAMAESYEPTGGTYRLVVERVGASGRARTQQGGSFELLGGVQDTLAMTTVNVSDGDELVVDLEVMWSDGRVDHDNRQIIG